MSLITHTYTAESFTAEVTDDNFVQIKKDGTLIDNPGPWGDHEGARLWAEAIVGKLATQLTASSTETTP